MSLLFEAVTAIGDAFGEDADCAAVAALLKLTAEDLGFNLTPRTVSLVATQLSTNDQAFMGPMATSLIPEGERHRVENYMPNGKDTGHMVLTSEEPPMLFDANLRQLGGFGIPAPSIAVRIRSTTPTDGGWTVELEDLQLVYILDESNDALWDRYRAALRGHASDAHSLAAMLRRGMTADDIGQLRRPRTRRR